MIALLLTIACSGDVPTPPKTTGAETPVELKTSKGLYSLRWKPVPGPVVMGELFSVETTLLDAEGKPVDSGSVLVDARMPQHGHGMTTRPVAEKGVCTGAGGGAAAGSSGETPLATCTHPQGIYRMDGMKFHMPGEWTVTFQVEGPAGPDKAEARYSL